MSKQSEFEEFIAMKVRPMYEGLEAGTGAQLTRSQVLEIMAEMTANHLIRECEEWYKEKDNKLPVPAADELIAFLKQYITGKAEVEG